MRIAARGAGRGLRVARPVAQRSAHALGGRAVDVRDADVVHLPVLEQVDAAPVGEARNREADEIGERLREVERLRQHLARLGEERQRLLAATLLGHVEERRDRGDDASAGVAYGLGADRDHAARAVRAPQHELAVGDRLARRAPGATNARCGASASVERAAPRISSARAFASTSRPEGASAIRTPSGSWRTSALSRSRSPCASW